MNAFPDDDVDARFLDPEERALVERSLADLLDLERNFAPDDMAPPVDERRIADQLADRLTGLERLEVSQLVWSYRTWHEALRRVARDRA